MIEAYEYNGSYYLFIIGDLGDVVWAGQYGELDQLKRDYESLDNAAALLRLEHGLHFPEDVYEFVKYGRKFNLEVDYDG